MTNTMTIGDFSRATRLSAKALRFYRQMGLLEPAWVDPVNGYRVYRVGQISDAQVIRDFRSLQMPVDLIREVLAAEDITARNALIATHLAQMEAQLEQTRAAVASLRGLLTPGIAPLSVVFRSVPAIPALVIRETIDLADLGPWYTEATRELEDVAASTAVRAAGPRGGIWETALFLDERGPAALFVPITPGPDYLGPDHLGPDHLGPGRVRVEVLPAVDLAMATHRGTDDTIGAVYAALGAYVTEHGLGIDGPIRELYLEETPVDDGSAVTEIGWPISRLAG